MNNIKKRLERIASGLSRLPCPACGQMRPTEAEQRSAAQLREKAREILKRLTAEYGDDEAAALAAMREVAPTLSSYLSVSFCSMCGFLPRVEKPIQTPEQMREKAEAMLAKLSVHYNGDRIAALAALREVAPTLSSYISLPG